MKTAKKIAASLTRQNIAGHVEAVRSDGGIRCVDVALLSNVKTIHHGKGSKSLHPAVDINVIMEVYV